MVFVYLVILVAVLRGTNCALCKSKEMVYNGNFEEPQITKSWTFVNSLPGEQGTWSTNPPENKFELWQPGHSNAPTKGPQGEDMGQHFEINGDRKWAQLIYTFDVPCFLGSDQATLSFDYWYRRNWRVNKFEVSVEQEGLLVKSVYHDQGNKWTTATRNFKVNACQYVKIYFTSDAQSTGGVHVDNVSFKVSVCEDIEMVTGGDFEQPVIEESKKEVQSLAGGDGTWTTSEATFMLKKQDVFMYMKRPQSSLMVQKPQNQFLWINALDTNAEVIYKFDVPYVIVKTVVGGLDCKLSFDYFLQVPEDVNYLKYTVEQFGNIVSEGEVSKQNNDVWENVFHQFSLTSQLPLQLIFTADTYNDSPVYIDNVSLKVAQPGIDLLD